jgi:hypothetical protein
MDVDHVWPLDNGRGRGAGPKLTPNRVVSNFNIELIFSLTTAPIRTGEKIEFDQRAKTNSPNDSTQFLIFRMR